MASRSSGLHRVPPPRNEATVSQEKPFWMGFERQGTGGRTKRHVIVLCWDESNRDVKQPVNRVRLRHPTVQVKLVDGAKAPGLLKAHKVASLPTVLLLRNGHEVDRVTGSRGAVSTTLLEDLFRKAST